MASNAAKARRRAEALNELNRLSGMVAEHVGIEVPDIQPTNNRDPELAQIQQVEAINGLLRDVLKAGGVEVEQASESEPEAESEQQAETTDEVSMAVEKTSGKGAKKTSNRRSKGKK